MQRNARLLEAHPHKNLPYELLADAITALNACSSANSTCASACLYDETFFDEKKNQRSKIDDYHGQTYYQRQARLRQCLEQNLISAKLTHLFADILSAHPSISKGQLRPLLEAVVDAVELAQEYNNAYAHEWEVCRLSAEACGECLYFCNTLSHFLGLGIDKEAS